MPRTIAICLLLIAAVFAAYWPVQNFGFVSYDDPLYVTECAKVQGGLSRDNIIWAFTTLDTGNWHPLTWLSHMLDAELFHNADGFPTAGGPHLVNVGLHALNAALAFLILLRITGMVWPSAIVAALFALHPLRVESVAWVAERKDVLSTFFGLLALLTYIAWTKRARSSAVRVLMYLLMIVCFAMSLLAKPMLVTLPVLMLILDWWPLRRWGDAGMQGRFDPPAEPGAKGMTRSIASLIIEKLPLFAMSAASSVITVIAQHRGGSVESLETLSIGARLANTVVSYARYLEKTFVPVELTVLYPYPTHWPLITVLGCTVLFVCITYVSIAFARRAPYLLAGWLWFVIALLPVIGLVQTGAQSMADRYSYLPSLGLYVAGVWAARDLLGADRRAISAVVAAAVVVLLGILTRIQVHVWSDSTVLYSHAVASTDGNWIMHLKLGTEYEQQQRFREAQEQFVLAASIRPKDVGAQFKVADILARQGRFADAKLGFRHVLTLDPDHAHALNNLAWLLATFPQDRAVDAPEAVRLAERAVELTHPPDASFLDTLATAHAANGRMDEAVRVARSARDLALQRGDETMAAQFEQTLNRFLQSQNAVPHNAAPQKRH